MPAFAAPYLAARCQLQARSTILPPPPPAEYPTRTLEQYLAVVVQAAPEPEPIEAPIAEWINELLISLRAAASGEPLHQSAAS